MPPTPTDYFIGLDLGTTSVKACAFNRDGKMLGESSREYPLLHPAAGAAVQEPQVLVSAAEESLVELIKQLDEKPAGIGLSCPMHGLILYNEHWRPVTPIITWADVRAQSVMEEFSPTDRRKLLRITGTPVHPMSPLVKLRWLARKHPQVINFSHYCYGIKEVLTGTWTKTPTLDEQLASANGMYDSGKGRWSVTALQIASGLNEAEYAKRGLPLGLPPVRPATHRLEWKEEVAERLGLTDVPLFLGGSDGVLANLGSGLLSPGEVALTVGTSGAVRTTHRQARIDPKHGLFNYKMFQDYYVIGGATNNGGKVLEYWQGLLSAHFKDIGAFIEAALSVKSENSPQFQPYLFGERAPLWDANAKAELNGLRGHHDHRHLARAVLDGVTDNLVVILRQLEAAVGPARRIHASGGFTQSPAWLGLLAEKAGREVIVTNHPQASAYGAALIARLGLGDLSLEELLP
ncbi:MAG: gluconokinase, partial [Bacteroidota bacterium]